MHRFLRQTCAALFSLLMISCSGGGGSEFAGGDDIGGSGQPAFPEQEPGQAAIEGGCSWPFVSDPDLLNIAYPDESATYWVANLPYVPGTRLRIDGQFPQARYFSFNVYDPALRPVDAITDYALLARKAGANPYRHAGLPYGGEYVAYVVPEPKPDDPAPNTLYSGSVALPGDNALPLNPVVMIIYRIYLPEVDGSGGVQLPKLTLENADGSTAPLAFSLCQPVPPDGVPDLLNAAIREASTPGEGAPPTGAPPRVTRFYNLFESGRALLSGQLGIEIPSNPLTEGGSGGFLSNVDNAYLTVLFTRRGGSSYVVRAKTPNYAAQPPDAPLGGAQLRYWSLCTNEFATQRFVACLADFQVPVDAQGYFTLVVSEPEDRPANAVPENGIAWLPWGAGYPDSLLIYRHMLPSAGFAEAIQNVPYGTPVEEVMGEYAPRVTYCDKPTIEAAGARAAQIFAQCAAAFAP